MALPRLRICAPTHVQVQDGKLFAIKCLNRSRIVMATQSGRLAKEIRLLKLLNHPNVIRLHEVLHTQAEIMMVMEYIDGGDLLDVLNTQPRFKEEEVRHIFGQIVCGVAFCRWDNQTSVAATTKKASCATKDGCFDHKSCASLIVTGGQRSSVLVQDR